MAAAWMTAWVAVVEAAGAAGVAIAAETAIEAAKSVTSHAADHKQCRTPPRAGVDHISADLRTGDQHRIGRSDTHRDRRRSFCLRPTSTPPSLVITFP